MKTVGKQLQDARLAKNWTPELAARETKIKVDRLRDLEEDNYSHFTSPTYARGFVRTYARALGLDEYRILRQLDNKLPEDDSANIVTDNSGVAYLPETAMPPRVAHRDFTGLYIVMGLGVVVALAIVFVLFQAYRVGELARYFGGNKEAVASAPVASTNAPATTTNSNGEVVARALPIDSNTPPPIEAPAATNAPVADVSTNAPADLAANMATNAPGPVSPKALPIDPSAVVSSGDTNATPIPVAPVSPRALPVDPASATSTTVPEPPQDPSMIQPTTPSTDPAIGTDVPVPVAPRALPVNPGDLAATQAASTNSLVAMNTSPTPPPVVHTAHSARESNNGPVIQPSQPIEAPIADPAPSPVIPTVAPVATPDAIAPTPATAPSASSAEKRLVLTASQDSFVRVTKLDGSNVDKPLYASVLHSGESVAFDGRKFSINVGIPAAVDIQLDGVNYGPHSDLEVPETFTVQSHLP